jgi:hypothetical protein
VWLGLRGVQLITVEKEKGTRDFVFVCEWVDWKRWKIEKKEGSVQDIDYKLWLS